MAMGWCEFERWGLRPRPASHDGENFLAPCPTLGALRSPAPPRKILFFLLICPTTSTIFLMKPISLKKLYLKLQLNLSHQIKSIFRKKINNISKCLTRQSLKKKKKIS